MLKNIIMLLISLVFALSAMHCFAFGPGAGPAQMQNNMQQMQQNKEQAKQWRQNQEMIQKKKTHQQQMIQQTQ